jgi:hypothetical protein
MENLRNAGLEQMGAQYADLRKLVIAWYHNHVLNETTTNGAITLATPPPSSAYAEAHRMNLLDNIADSPYHHDPCLSKSYSPSLISLSSTD